MFAKQEAKANAEEYKHAKEITQKKAGALPLC
jgi:hypothetical protein